MRIFVVGNINCGKTYFINKLKHFFPNYTILAIDEYRIKYSDGSLEEEVNVRSRFAEDIMKHSNVIIEFSGGSTISSLFIDRLRKNSFIVLEVKEILSVCIERIKYKDFSRIPYPKFSESLEDTIIRLDKEFSNNVISENFKDKFLIKYDISSNDIIEDLPLKQYENAIKIADYFNNQCDALVAYGSLGRQDMNIYSDIDLYMVTQEEFRVVYKQLQSLFPAADFITQKNQIDIFIVDQLIEITIIKKIQSIELYYIKSEIIKPEKTMLLDKGGYYGKLKKIIKNYRYNFSDEFSYTLSRMQYYYRSLERIIKKNDQYKYFFHNNIIIHEYLKLQYFMMGKRAYSYLPKNGLDCFSLDVFNQLLYKPGMNQKEHFDTISRIVEDIVRQANLYLLEHKKRCHS